MCWEFVGERAVDIEGAEFLEHQGELRSEGLAVGSDGNSFFVGSLR